MEFVKQPWEHQLQALKKQSLLNGGHRNGASFALFMDVGTGKSKAAIEIWRQRCTKEKRFLRTLIFVPPVVVPKWKKEFLNNSRVPASQIHLLQGTGAKRQKDFFRTAIFPEPRTGIFVTNYESLLMPTLFKDMLFWKPEALIFDESHEIKNYKAKRSKRAYELAHIAGHDSFKQILSGSPILNRGAEDLFHQFLVLDGGITFGTNFFIFQARYFRDRNAGMPKQKYFPRWELMTLQKDGFDAETAIRQAMGLRMFAAKKKDCLDLPPLVEETITVPMSAEQARVYGEMKRDLIAYLNDKACIATLAMTKFLRLQQIASGYIKTVDGEEIPLGGTPKMEVLEEFITQITPHAKVLVWAAWRQNYAEIRAVFNKLGVKFVEIHGDISASKKQEAMHALNNDPDVRGFIGHPGAGGVGIDLIQASYSITYSRTTSIKHKIQKDGRNYRGGSEIHEKITQYDLVAENTCDEIICERLAKGIEVSDTMLKGIALQLQEQGN